MGHDSIKRSRGRSQTYLIRFIRPRRLAHNTIRLLSLIISEFTARLQVMDL